jgi:predicted outer membrane repeat protein
LYNNANPTFIGTGLRNNYATSGGAIFVTDSAFPHFENVEMAANSASSRGGALYVTNEANITMNHCLVWLNSATGPGGGIVLQDFASIKIQSSNFSVSES